MKKMLCTAMLFAIPLIVSADDDSLNEIMLYSVDISTRSMSVIPKASIYQDVLAVCFDESDVFYLSIENANGETLYVSTLPADGMEYSYDLSGIGEGMFRLVLEGPGGEYEGYFTL